MQQYMITKRVAVGIPCWLVSSVPSERNFGPQGLISQALRDYVALSFCANGPCAAKKVCTIHLRILHRKQSQRNTSARIGPRPTIESI